MEWNYLSIPKLQRYHRWGLGMDKWFHPTVYRAYDYLSMLGLKLSHVGKRTPGASELKQFSSLTHWGRVTHICVSNLTIIGSANGLTPGRRQAIIWTNAGILSIRPAGTNFSETLIEIDVFSFKKMHLKMSSGKWRPFRLGLNVLRVTIGRFSYEVRCNTMLIEQCSDEDETEMIL